VICWLCSIFWFILDTVAIELVSFPVMLVLGLGLRG